MVLASSLPVRLMAPVKMVVGRHDLDLRAGCQRVVHAREHAVERAFACRLDDHVGQAVDDVPVVAGAAGHVVLAGAAVEPVVAAAAVEVVVAAKADQHVVAAAAVERVVAGIAVDGVGELVAGEVDGAGAERVGGRHQLDTDAGRQHIVHAGEHPIERAFAGSLR